MPAPPPYPGVPRWVRVAAILAVLIVAFLAVHLLGGGFHGRMHR